MAVLVHACAFLCYLSDLKFTITLIPAEDLLQAVTSVTLALENIFLYTFLFFHRLYMHKGIRNGGNHNQ